MARFHRRPVASSAVRLLRHRLRVELLEGRLLPSTFSVTNNTDCNVDGCGSLREAIEDANFSGGADTIDFSIGGGGAQTISPTSALPNVTGETTIDGTTQPGFAGVPLIELEGSSAGTASGLVFDGGSSNSTVRSLVINRWPVWGISTMNNPSNITIVGNYIGTDAAGTTASSNGTAGDGTRGGVALTGGSGHQVGGTTAADRNVLSGNHVQNLAFCATGSVVVEGNYIGTNAGGTSAPTGAPNGNGIIASCGPASLIGGTAAGAGNVISGNNGYGIQTGGASTNITVQGNFIGTNLSGTTAVANNTGIFLGGSTNLVGGSTSAARNVISGNVQNGIDLRADNNKIQGNYIGTDVTGTVALGNGLTGVHTQDSASNNFIGTDGDGVNDATEGNLVSGNSRAITIGNGSGPFSGNRIAGNRIGTDATGTVAIPNGSGGVFIESGAQNNVVGTNGDGVSDALERNIISGNAQQGVYIAGTGTTNNTVAGNYIGTDITGTVAIANNRGIQLDGVDSNLIGGAIPAARNVISGNTLQNIHVRGNSNRIQGNYIGTDVSGTKGFAGTGAVSGIFLINASTLNVIGTDGDGTDDATEGNLISGMGIGVFFNGSNVNDNTVAGNIIGPDFTGMSLLSSGTSGFGVSIDNGSFDNIIGTNADGTSDALERNIVSGHDQSGVDIARAGTSGNDVAGNYIGVNAAGTAALTNDIGVNIAISASNNTIGGTLAAARNVISGNAIDGIRIRDAGTTGNLVQGNFIGTDATGTLDVGNGGGVVMSAVGNTLGGTTPAARNIISGNNVGVHFEEVSVIQGNYIGTDVTGTNNVSNPIGMLGCPNGGTIGGTASGAGNFIYGGTNGVNLDNMTSCTVVGNRIIGSTVGITMVNSVNHTIGGTAAGARNVISGNGTGLKLNGCITTGMVIQGNYIGTDETGTVAQGNGIGIRFDCSSTNTIGGTAPGAGNVISANTTGLYVSGILNTIQGNYIGTDVTGELDLGNGTGIRLLDGNNVLPNIVGGTTAAARNIISANNVGIEHQATLANLILGNYIGTDKDGTAPLGNSIGILVSGSKITIGDTVAGAGNVISGNNLYGILAPSGVDTDVFGNFIGTNAAGTGAIANGSGVVLGGTSGRIGGDTAGHRNLISGNTLHGVILSGSNHLVEGNVIGTDLTGTIAIANGGDGVYVTGANNVIGGTISGVPNLIAHNLGRGVQVDGGVQNAIRQNSIHSNGGLGIDLTNNGNNNQPPPGTIKATSGGGATNITVGLFSTPNTTFSIDLFSNAVCDPSTFGEGETFLTSTTLTTNAAGRGRKMVTLGFEVSVAHVLTATATRPSNDTSEFSKCFAVTASTAPSGHHQGRGLAVPVADSFPNNDERKVIQPESHLTDERFRHDFGVSLQVSDTPAPVSDRAGGKSVAYPSESLDAENGPEALATLDDGLVTDLRR